jgi:YcxB-like protein
MHVLAWGVTPSENRTVSEDGRRVTFSWEAAEHAEVVRLLVREQMRRGLWRAVKWLVRGVVALAWLVVALTIWAGDWRSLKTLLPLLLVATVLLIGFGRITGWLRAFQIRKTDPNVGHPFTYEFRDSGLRLTLHTATSELRWGGMARIRETADMFLFYYNPRTAYFLPKRAVGPRSEIEALRGWIRLRLPEGVEYVTDVA